MNYLHTADKALREKAAEGFHRKLLTPNYGHKLKLKWLEPTGTGWLGDLWHFRITCKKCRKTVVAEYRNVQNSDGSIPMGSISQANAHILMAQKREEAKGAIAVDSRLIMEVEMKRGRNHEYWLVHYKDTDFFESIDMLPAGSEWAQWSVLFRNTRGWKRSNTWVTEEEAFGWVVKQKQKYELKGLSPIVKSSMDTGVTSVAATVKVSVRKLIDDYKAANPDNPVEIKEWMEKADEALQNMELLQALREEVSHDMTDVLGKMFLEPVDV